MAVTVAQVRTIALGLPETAEVVTWGTDLTWRVRDKIFAMGAPESPNVSVKCSKEEQFELIAMAPDRAEDLGQGLRRGLRKLHRLGAGDLRECRVQIAIQRPATGVEQVGDQ